MTDDADLGGVLGAVHSGFGGTDDAVARVYERAVFRRIGSACMAEAGS
ncbi:MAG: hypothetical protein ACXV3V_09010 [Actinomycetes bacterium]